MRRTQTKFVAVLLFLCVASGASLAGGPVAASPDAIQPLLIGAQVPELTLKTGAGEAYDLNAALSRKPTILVIYRGGW